MIIHAKADNLEAASCQIEAKSIRDDMTAMDVMGEFKQELEDLIEKLESLLEAEEQLVETKTLLGQIRTENEGCYNKIEELELENEQLKFSLESLNLANAARDEDNQSSDIGDSPAVSKLREELEQYKKLAQEQKAMIKSYEDYVQDLDDGVKSEAHLAPLGATEYQNQRVEEALKGGIKSGVSSQEVDFSPAPNLNHNSNSNLDDYGGFKRKRSSMDTDHLRSLCSNLGIKSSSKAAKLLFMELESALEATKAKEENFEKLKSRLNRMKDEKQNLELDLQDRTLELKKVRTEVVNLEHENSLLVENFKKIEEELKSVTARNRFDQKEDYSPASGGMRYQQRSAVSQSKRSLLSIKDCSGGPLVLEVSRSDGSCGNEVLNMRMLEKNDTALRALEQEIRYLRKENQELKEETNQRRRKKRRRTGSSYISNTLNTERDSLIQESIEKVNWYRKNTPKYLPEKRRKISRMAHIVDQTMIEDSPDSELSLLSYKKRRIFTTGAGEGEEDSLYEITRSHSSSRNSKKGGRKTIINQSGNQRGGVRRVDSRGRMRSGKSLGGQNRFKMLKRSMKSSFNRNMRYKELYLEEGDPQKSDKDKRAKKRRNDSLSSSFSQKEKKRSRKVFKKTQKRKIKNSRKKFGSKMKKRDSDVFALQTTYQEGSSDKENHMINSNLMKKFTKTINKFDRKLAKIRNNLDTDTKMKTH